MSINLFFTLIAVSLISMTIVFKPFGGGGLASEKLPQIELNKFAVYELSDQGLEHFFEADKGKKFDTYYEVENARFSNNTRALFESIRSDHAHYADEIIHLKGNVRYEREDGLRFHSQEGEYNQKRSTITTDGSFMITKGAHKVEGTRLFYDLETENVSADKVRGSYYFN